MPTTKKLNLKALWKDKNKINNNLKKEDITPKLDNKRKFLVSLNSIKTDKNQNIDTKKDIKNNIANQNQNIDTKKSKLLFKNYSSLEEENEKKPDIENKKLQKWKIKKIILIITLLWSLSFWVFFIITTPKLKYIFNNIKTNVLWIKEKSIDVTIPINKGKIKTSNTKSEIKKEIKSKEKIRKEKIKNFLIKNYK